MRVKLFVAIEVPDALRAALSTLPDAVCAEGWRRTSPSLMHVTVRFVGDIPADRIAGLTRALDIVAARSAPFTVRVEGIGVFGKPEKPRVLWAGVHDDEPGRALATLAGDIDAAIDPIVADVVGTRDRPFAAHITLARAKPNAKPPAKGFSGSMSMPVEELVLFDSAPSPLAYTPVWRGRLGTRSHGEAAG